MADKPRVLVIDDGEDYARIVAEHLQEFHLVRPGRGATRLPDGPSALRYLKKHAAKVDVVLLDVRFNLPEERLLPLGEGASLRQTQRFQGVAIYRALRRLASQLPVVMLTAVEDLSLVDVKGELSKHSMTYFLDHDDLDTLRVRINAALRQASQGSEEDSVLWGRDPVMQALRRRLAVLARGNMPLILEGETGTGKSFLAEHFVHRHSGRRGNFVVLDLSTIPRDLMPAHLFGATKGAYTGSVSDRQGVFELAHGGTLFIDEIQNAPLDVQRQLLLVLHDRRVTPLGASQAIAVDVKVVAGSNVSLQEAVAQGTFRQDLYMRLGPATRVELPPLRARPSDLLFLARRMVERAARHPDNDGLREQVGLAAGLGADVPVHLVVGIASDPEPSPERALHLVLPKPAWDMLRRYPWPGNLRELSMVMHNLVTLTLVDIVDALEAGSPLSSVKLQVDPGLVGELLSSWPQTKLPPQEGAESPDKGSDPRPGVYSVVVQPNRSLSAVTTDVERQFYRALFRETKGDFERMAERLLGDASKGRAVRLRFNQIGLKARELRSWR